MNITIANNFLKATINTKGAELNSLVFLPKNKNIIWHGDAAYWGKHSPILFPIVGTLNNNTYTYNNQSYTLGRHGFAREMEWIVKTQTTNSCILVLQYNTETYAIYPFEFEVAIIYSLLDNELQCMYQVKNIGNKAMYFSLGAHPAFNVPIEDENKFEQYSLQFNNNISQLVRHKLNEKGLFDNLTEVIELQDGKLPLTHDLFYEDAIVLKELTSSKINIATINENEMQYEFSWFNFPHFGIWQPKDALFLCLEPWQGFADDETHNGDITQKQGIVNLNPKEIWNANWRIKIK